MKTQPGAGPTLLCSLTQPHCMGRTARVPQGSLEMQDPRDGVRLYRRLANSLRQWVHPWCAPHAPTHTQPGEGPFIEGSTPSTPRLLGPPGPEGFYLATHYHLTTMVQIARKGLRGCQGCALPPSEPCCAPCCHPPWAPFGGQRLTFMPATSMRVRTWNWAPT